MIGIIGSFGSGNLGDEAIWTSIKQFLEEKDPKYKFQTHIFQWSFPHQPCGYHTHSIFTLSDQQIDWINRNFEAMIVVGGGVVGWSFGAVKTDTSIFNRVFSRITVPIYTISIGAEPGEYDEITHTNTKILYQKSRMFTVRNQTSKDTIWKLLGKDVEITPDIATLLKSTRRGNIVPNKFTDKTVLTTASNCVDDKIIAFWREFFRMAGGTASVMPVPFTHGCNDIMLHQAMQENLTYELYTPEEMQEVIRNCPFVIAGRLHAAVFASNVGVPFVAVNYHPKVRQFCESIGCESYWPEDEQLLSKDMTQYGYRYWDFNPVDLKNVFDYVKWQGKPKMDVYTNQQKVAEKLEEVWRDIKQ